MDMPDSSSRLEFKEIPFALWIFGLVFAAFGVYIISTGEGLIGGVIMMVLGLLVTLLWAAVHTVVIDRNLGTMTIRHRNLLRNKVHEINLTEIANVIVETRHTTKSRYRRGGPTHRIVVVKTSGELVPLQEDYSSGYHAKAKKARQICDFLGLPGWEDRPAAVFQAGLRVQAAHPAVPEQSGSTGGVDWTLGVYGSSAQPVTRWSSPSPVWTGNFLLVAQKPRGSASLFGGGGLLGGLSQILYQQVLGIYGFSPADTPGIERARALQQPEPDLDADYSVLSSDPVEAARLLTPWVIHPLRNWADAHPMHTVQVGGQPGQLVVLLSPQGVTLAVLGSLTEEQQQELVYLGVDVVKGLGGTSAKRTETESSSW